MIWRQAVVGHVPVRLAIVSLILSGCATNYVNRMSAVRQAYEAGDTDSAIRQLDAFKNTAEEKGINRLLLLLDRGMILHAGGRWKESNEVLHAADELMKELDFTSVSEEAQVLLTNEGTRVYRGEDFEKLMISLLLALNYYQLDQDEDALVEVRRINERIQKMIAEEKKPYEQLGVARYVGGALWEDQRELDSAAIDYLEAAKLMKGDWATLAPPLMSLLKKTEREDALKALKQRFPGAGQEEPYSSKKAQLVVLVEAGRAPQKSSSSQTVYGKEGRNALIAVPIYGPRRVPVPLASISVGGGPPVRAAVVTSIDEVAKVHLGDRIGKLIAKQAASLLLKAGAAAAVGAATKNEALGALTFLALSATQQADTRSWLTLPAEFQVARATVEPGDHSVTIDCGGRKSTHQVKARAGRVALVIVRRF